MIFFDPEVRRDYTDPIPAGCGRAEVIITMPSPGDSLYQKKTTIRDVAKKANVSIATVSRVVNKNYYVDPETTQKVEKAIRDTGYYPDAIARTMRRNVSFTIGFVVSDLNNTHFTLIAKMIDQTIQKQDYNLIVCSSDGDTQSENRYLRTLMSKKVDGLVVHTNGDNDDLVTELSRQVPIVLVYRKIADQEFWGDFVGSEDFDGAYRLARHVLSYGHRNIGLINGDLLLSTGRERFAGFQQALKEAGVRLSPSMVFNGNYHFESGIEGAKKLLSGAKRPSIIVALSNALAMGVMTHLREQSVSIPGDISFASFGDLSNHELLYVKPTIIRQYPARVGEVAAELLLRRIADRSKKPEIVRVPSPLMPGDSIARIGPPPKGFRSDGESFGNGGK